VPIAGTSSTAKKSVIECYLFFSYIISIHYHYNGFHSNFNWKNYGISHKNVGSLNSVCVFLRIRSRGITFQYSLICICMGISSSYKTLKDKQQSKQNFISQFSYLYSLHVQTCVLCVSGNVLLLSLAIHGLHPDLLWVGNGVWNIEFFKVSCMGH